MIQFLFLFAPVVVLIAVLVIQRFQPETKEKPSVAPERAEPMF